MAEGSLRAARGRRAAATPPSTIPHGGTAAPRVLSDSEDELGTTGVFLGGFLLPCLAIFFEDDGGFGGWLRAIT